MYRLSYNIIPQKLLLFLSSVITLIVAIHQGNNATFPPEAIPIWKNSDLTFLNKVIEYMFPMVLPFRSMTSCPTEEPLNSECMSKARNSMDALDKAEWKKLLKKGTHIETSFVVEDSNNWNKLPDVEVVVLRPSDCTDAELRDLPKIVFIHGGGFVLGGARSSYLMSLMNGLQDTAAVDLNQVVWVSLEYPLAPEFKYPVIAKVCANVLYRLFTEHKFGMDGGELHVVGTSAGATLALQAVQSVLKRGLNIDSLYIDNLVLPLHYDERLQNSTAFEGESYRRNYFTRITPIDWVDWFVRAGGGRDFGDLEQTLMEQQWRQAAAKAKRGLPPVLSVTNTGDIFRDGAFPLDEVYKRSGGIVHHIEAKASHALHLVVDKKAARILFETWGRMIAKTYFPEFGEGVNAKSN